MTDSTNIYTGTSPLSPQQKEENKISYWLEKLFRQEEEKNRIPSDAKDVKPPPVNNIKQESNTSRQRKTEKDKRAIRDMVHDSNAILMSISSVYPFDLFPSTINVEATRVTIITRQLFASQVHSIDIKDISSVFIETSIIFAAITLKSKTYEQKELLINNLWKKEAILLRRIIEGLRMFEKKDINTTDFSKEELLYKLEELSETKIVL